MLTPKKKKSFEEQEKEKGAESGLNREASLGSPCLFQRECFLLITT